MRFALYYAPAPSSQLWELGCKWLGRDAMTGRKIKQDVFFGIDPDRLYELTRIPRRYGLHATLKAPFRLAADCDPVMLQAAMDDFAGCWQPFALPPLKLQQKKDFFCLCPDPEKQTSELNNFAAACVQYFDGFRASPTAGERARRRADILSAVEKENMIHWGYPYIFDQFRFHITLTSRMSCKAEKEAVHSALFDMFAPVIGISLVIDAIYLFIEPAPGQSLFCAGRFPLNSSQPGADIQRAMKSRNRKALIFDMSEGQTGRPDGWDPAILDL